MSRTTVMLTGGKGMLGRTLCRELEGFEVIPTDLPETDILQEDAFARQLDRVAPDVVIHCAAMTAVDRCEAEPDLAYRLNALGSANVAAACVRRHIRLVALSTDYVFSGTGQRPYHEFDVPDGGINVYGQSKWAGEQAVRTHCPDHVIARISWLYGPGGPSFVHTMLRLARQGHEVLRVVDDQRGNPTSTSAVAAALRHILLRPGLVGTFHLTCEGETTWYGFAREIFRLAGMEQCVVPCTSAEYVTPARRPENSCLEMRMLCLLGLPSMPHWQESLADFMRSQSRELGIPAASVPDAGR